MGMSSIPTSVSWAASNDVTPSIGRVIRLTALWYCSIEFITIRSLYARGEAHPEIVQSTAEVPHPSADAPLPEAASVFDAVTALDTVMDRVDPPPLVELLVRHVLLPR